MDLKEKLLESKQIFAGRMISLRNDTVVLPNGKQAGREWVQHPGAVAIVAVDHDSRVCMVRQYRYPVGCELLEIPAGKLEKGEDPLDCARRELLEEAGLIAGSWERVFSYFSTPGFCDEILHLFLATDLSAGEGSPDDDEFLEAIMVSFDDACEMLNTGEIRDSKTLIGLLYLASRGWRV